jgi:DNA-binding response OmpR family regulator
VTDSSQPAKAARFGPFELDLKTSCLTRKGQQERLAVQPARLLVMLVQRRGELVTRGICARSYGRGTRLAISTTALTTP